MKRNTTITTLSTIKARNLMRGLISNTDPGHAMRALEKIRSECSESEFRQALLVLRGNEIFGRSAIGRDFNKRFPRLIRKGVTTPFRPEQILTKIASNTKKISELLGISAEILQSISGHDYDTAIQYCEKLIEHEGASTIVLRYLQFVRNHASGAQGLAKKIDQMLNEAAVENVRYISNVMRELSSPRTDYFNISERILKTDWTVSVAIARAFINNIPRTPE